MYKALFLGASLLPFSSGSRVDQLQGQVAPQQYLAPKMLTLLEDSPFDSLYTLSWKSTEEDGMYVHSSQLVLGRDISSLFKK